MLPYSHVTIKQVAVVDYYLELLFISILILKAIDSTKKSKRFPSQSSLQAFKRHACIYKEQKGHSIEENQQQVISFFFSCWKSKWISWITNKAKGETAMNEWENDDSDKLLALYIGFIKKSGQCFFLTY